MSRRYLFSALVAPPRSLTKTVELSGDWSVNANCEVKADVYTSLCEFKVFAWLSGNGGAMPGLVARLSDSYWMAGTFVPFNR